MSYVKRNQLDTYEFPSFDPKTVFEALINIKMKKDYIIKGIIFF